MPEWLAGKEGAGFRPVSPNLSGLGVAEAASLLARPGLAWPSRYGCAEVRIFSRVGRTLGLALSACSALFLELPPWYCEQPHIRPLFYS